MLLQKSILLFIIAACCTIIVTAFNCSTCGDDDFIIYKTSGQHNNIKLYSKDNHQQLLLTLQRLKNYAESCGEDLLFGMNGGMYMANHAPLGLLIQNGKILSPLNNANGNGNFYLQPNGVLYLTKNKEAHLCETADFIYSGDIEYATQSGPMLLINGQIHPAFQQGSSNLNIRNGVGLLPGNELLFAMSKHPVNFYDFAAFLKKAGCSNALYLDGFVSRTYLPEKGWIQLDGNFGVMIGVTKKNNSRQ